jgi:PEP-CTERM motif
MTILSVSRAFSSRPNNSRGWIKTSSARSKIAGSMSEHMFVNDQRGFARRVPIYSLRWLTFALGTTVTLNSAHALLSLPVGDYSNSGVSVTSGGVGPAYGALAAFNQGGLCQQTARAVGCLSIPSGSQGPTLTSGLASPLANYDGTIAINPNQLPNGDSDYTLDIHITDTSSTAGSYYEVTVNGIYIAETPVVTEGGASKSNGTITVNFSNGMALNPATIYLGITNGYFANTASPAFTGSELSLSVTELDIPEPASLAMFTVGLGLLSLLRRYRNWV